jgi:hypothetical protein
LLLFAETGLNLRQLQALLQLKKAPVVLQKVNVPDNGLFGILSADRLQLFWATFLVDRGTPRERTVGHVCSFCPIRGELARWLVLVFLVFFVGECMHALCNIVFSPLLMAQSTTPTLQAL